MNQLIVNTLHLCALLVLAAGCAVGPDYVRPETDTAETWSESHDANLSTDPVEYGRWWAVFEDPTLEQLVQLASRENLPVQIAASRILEARAVLGISRGSRFPQQQQLAGHAARVSLSANAPNVAIADQAFSSYGVSFDAAWELDVWGRLRRGVEAADADYGRALAGYDDTLVTVTAEIARAYILLRTFEARLGLARQNVLIQRETLRIAEVRFKNGAVTRLDVTQSRAQLRDTEALIPSLETGARQTRHAISTLIGQPPGQLDELLQQKSSIPSAPAKIAIGAPVDLLRRRPDVRIAEFQAAAQSARIGIAKSDLDPRFSLFGSIGFATSSDGGSQSNNSDAGDLISSDSIRYIVGPAFSWPIFNYGRLRNNVKIQDARFQQAALNYQNTVLEAAREVEDALAAYLRNQTRVGYLTDSVTDARRSVELALVQYRQGSTTYQRVLDTQRFLVRQEDQLASTQGDVALNLVATYKALGGGWETEQSEGAQQ
jgi:NodT family efflux transporter outer membrane factor (OMF) lipoprotein